MSCRDYRIRTSSKSKGQYVVGRYESGYIQPTGKLEKRIFAKKVRAFKGEITNGSMYKKLYANVLELVECCQGG